MINLLMVGNSFTDANGLEEMVQALLEETAAAASSIYALRFEHGGAKFVEHAADNSLKAMMAERKWTWCVLQEQSEIPGFWGTDFVQEYNDSMQAADVLNEWIRDEAHAETVLMMTWARRTNDPYNPTLFPNFTTMQARVATGYYNMQKQLSTPTRQVHIAPAGLAFQTVYNQVQATTGDAPTANGTTFSNLYAADGIHPSTAGSYLVACVIYATLTGRTDLLPHLLYAPPDMNASLRQQLQQAAAMTVNQFNQEHSWNRQDASRPYNNVLPSSSQWATDDNDYDASAAAGAGGGRSTGDIPVMIVVLTTALAFTLVLLKRRHYHYYQNATTTMKTRNSAYHNDDEFSLEPQLELTDLDNKPHSDGGMYGERSML